MNIKINYTYEQTRCLVVNMHLLLLVQFTLQNSARRSENLRSFPSLDLCRMQTNDIIVLSVEDTSALLHLLVL